MQQMNPDQIDLDLAERAVSLLINDNEQQQQQQKYQPRTLNQHNHGRYAYLPQFPTNTCGLNDDLLLPNVSVTRLSSHEMARRQHGPYTPDAIMRMHDYKYACNQLFTLSEPDAKDLAAHLNVPMSIITFNAERLNGICYRLLALHETFRRNVLRQSDVALKDATFYSRGMAIALEFFLQIDVDVFYMKTCSFLGAAAAKPELNVSKLGLFCGEGEQPQPRYAMTPCGKLSCPFCHPQDASSSSSLSCCCCSSATAIAAAQANQSYSSVIDFVSSSMHEFVNGYTTYLNGPVTCHTSHVIYVMTCPCRQYDFVDSTSETLADALAYHQKHGNRIIHEKLTGSSLFPGMIEPGSYIARQKAIVNQMRLYQHSAQCPVALRRFLDFNPDYWSFIPLLRDDDAHTEHIAYFQGIHPSASVSSLSSHSDISTIEKTSIIAMGDFGDRTLAQCLKDVPQPPTGYAFSYEQQRKQRLFFEQFLASLVDQRPYLPVDLYKVAVIAVLPGDCSVILRYITETFFIIHGETKLNMICPIGIDPEKYYGRPYHDLWCKNLNRPYATTATAAASNQY